MKFAVHTSLFTWAMAAQSWCAIHEQPMLIIANLLATKEIMVAAFRHYAQLRL